MLLASSPVSRDEKPFSSCHLWLHLHPLFLLYMNSLLFFLLSIPTLPISLPPTIFARLFPPLPFFEFSFLAKRLVGVFSTVVTFRTVCHLSLSLSHLSLSLAHWPSHPPSSSCREGLLEPGIEAGMYAFKCLCVGCVWSIPLTQTFKSIPLSSVPFRGVAWLWVPLQH